jgi:hypothetical protein
MNTFICDRNLVRNFYTLDYRRHGKQRVEAYQILRILEGCGRGTGWQTHPAVLMWRGWEDSLRQYLRASIITWKRRGYRNTMLIPHKTICSWKLPSWVTDEFIQRHRSNLLRKDPDYYGQFGWGVEPGLEYIWPVKLA